ncbi:MAG TPA: hypothetical protein VMX38_21200 [Verrucomicrobiae bacterium]|jgi:hypothetical protein|nr:hypothetical protein [Verrucomicrobiae bacterium]
MNLSIDRRLLRKLALFSIAAALPVAMSAQQNKKTSSPPPKAPAKSSTPSQRPSTPTNGNRPNTPNGNRSNTMTNSNRSNMNGNRPNANANRPNANGNRPNTSATARGNMAAPGRQVTLRGGGSASIRPNGQIRSVSRNGMTINRGMHGGRVVVSVHNNVRIVNVGRGGGYVQRAYFARGGRSYYSRTYYVHGVYRVGVYRGYYWGGRPYYGYYPGFYYHPVYYGWAYNPWPAPVYYGWGWGAAPWYGYYGPAYYQPYPVYPAAYFWLTDWMIAANLQAAYAAQAEANAELLPLTPDPTLVASLMPLAAADAPKVAMTKEVKDALAEEVKAVLASEQTDASKPKGSSGGGQSPATSNTPPPALDPNFKTFVVSSDSSLVANGDECALSQGDVIERTSDTPDSDGNVTVKVVASTKNDCAIGKEGPISSDDLQEMYNSFRDSLKDGMGELAKKNGSGGLPKAPDTSTSDSDVPPPPADKTAQKTLDDQQSAADQTETEVKQEAGSGSGGGR